MKSPINKLFCRICPQCRVVLDDQELRELKLKVQVLEDALKEYTCDKFFAPAFGEYSKFYGDRFKASEALKVLKKKDTDDGL